MREEAEVGYMEAELLWGKKSKGKKGGDMQIGEATKKMGEGIAKRQK